MDMNKYILDEDRKDRMKKVGRREGRTGTIEKEWCGKMKEKRQGEER